MFSGKQIQDKNHCVCVFNNVGKIDYVYCWKADGRSDTIIDVTNDGSCYRQQTEICNIKSLI